MIPFKNIHIALYALFFVAFHTKAQLTNKEVAAKIEVEQVDDVANISGKATNITEVYKSLTYKMTVFRTDLTTNNLSKSEQSGRFSLEPNESKLLSATSVNVNTDDKIVVLLLVFQDEKIIGKARVAYNERREQQKKETEEVAVGPRDGLEIRGIVVDDTRTKPGRDFYDAFYAQYTLNKINGDKVVKVVEKFAQARTTIIEVYVDDDKVHEFITRPGYDYIEAMSKQSIRRVHRQFQNLKRQKELITRY